jgi:flagellar biosynthesis protein FliQ
MLKNGLIFSILFFYTKFDNNTLIFYNIIIVILLTDFLTNVYGCDD